MSRTTVIRPVCLALAALLTVVVSPLPSSGQVTPDEHAKHHPGQEKDKGGSPGMAPDGKGPAMGMGAGMEGMMDGMMKKMGVPPPRDLYPSLMSLPDLTPEQREQVQSLARERMHSGAALMSEGLDRLAQATEKEKYLAMQEATAQVREGLAQFVKPGVT